MNKIIKKFKTLARYQITYLEMNLRLKQVLKGKRKYSYKIIDDNDRNIGKSTALARLSVKYDIPIAIPYRHCEHLFKYDIPKYVPKYFKNKKPKVIAINEGARGKRYNMLLIEENLTAEQLQIVNVICNGRMIGYKNSDWILIK